MLSKKLISIFVATILTVNVHPTIKLRSISIEEEASCKKAIIFGVTGQDGAYLSELLLEKNYIVHGVKRRSSSLNTSRIDHIYEDSHLLNADKRFILHYGDITDASNVLRIIQDVQPDEIYNLAAQSHVQVSFEMPVYTAQVDGLGTLNILEAIRCAGLTKKTKFYQASTSELFGKVQEIPQKRDNTVLSTLSLCCGKNIQLLDYYKLSRGL